MKTFTWTVEITVDETWVADGFELNDERLHAMIAEALPYAYSHEFSGRVLSAPDRASVLEAQGYDPALGEPDPVTGLQTRA